MLRAHLIAISVAATAVWAMPAYAEDVMVDVHKISAEGIGEKAGTIKVIEAEGGGLTFEVAVEGQPAGEHGFHVHENGNCEAGEKGGQKQAGLAAGGHFDPMKLGKHAGPDGQGHLGDLPKLELKSDGAPVSVTAPHLKLADVRGRALIIHEGGDTYSDQPELGGGGARIACGVVPQKSAER